MNNVAINRRGISDPNKAFQRKISMNNGNNNGGRFDIINQHNKRIPTSNNFMNRAID